MKRRYRNYIRVNIVALVALALVQPNAVAETSDSKNSTDPVVDELKKSTARLEAQIENNTKSLDLLKQQVPTLEGGKEGEASKGAYAIGAWEKVFERMTDAANVLCTKLDVAGKGENIKDGVIVVSEEDIQLPAVYTLVSAEQKRLRKELNNLLQKLPQASTGPAVGPSGAAAPPVAALGVIASSAISIAKLFRTDRTLYAEATTISTTALKDEIVKCLSTRKALDPNFSVDYPALSSQHTLLSSSDSHFLTEIQTLATDRQSADLALMQMAKAARPAGATDLFGQIDKFLTDLMSTSATQSEPPLVSTVRGEAVHRGLTANKSLLLLGIPQQGGLSMVTSSVWRSDRLYVGGGIILAYRLSKGGLLLDSGIIPKVDPEMMQVPLEK
jgi:hypothetical protein